MNNKTKIAIAFGIVSCVGCGEGAGTADGCVDASVVVFEPAFDQPGTYELHIDAGEVEGTCSVELTSQGHNAVTCPEGWDVLATTTTTEVDDGGLSPSMEPEITGIQLDQLDPNQPDLLEAAEVDVRVVFDGTVLVDDTFLVEDETLGDSCGTRRRANVAVP